MDLPGVAGSLSSASHKKQPQQSASAAAEGQEAQTTHQMLGRYYQHVDREWRLQRSTDERIMDIQEYADGAGQMQAAVPRSNKP